MRYSQYFGRLRKRADLPEPPRTYQRLYFRGSYDASVQLPTVSLLSHFAAVHG